MTVSAYRGNASAPTGGASGKPLSVSVSGGDGVFDSLALTGLLDISNANAGQIKFPATQNASSNANTLDDYEEGTFTPTFTFSSPGTFAITYALQAAAYTKIGRVVHIQLSLESATFTKGTAASSAIINTLPFAPGISPGFFTFRAGKMIFEGITLAAFTQYQAAPFFNTTQIQILGSGTSQSNTIINALRFTDGVNIKFYIQVSYHAAS